MVINVFNMLYVLDIISSVVYVENCVMCIYRCKIINISSTRNKHEQRASLPTSLKSTSGCLLCMASKDKVGVAHGGVCP